MNERMSEIQNTYLALLRIALWGDELKSERMNELTNEGINDIIQLAAFQGTGPLVYDQLLKIKNGIDPAIRMQMKQQCVSNMMLQQSMIPILKEAWSALEDVDIHPVLLKGFGIAQYYPQPYLRQWGDMDIYVGQSNYHKACGKLRETFPNAIPSDKEDEDYKHYNFDFDNTAIEAHRVSMTFPHPRDRRYYEPLEERSLTKDGPKFEIDGLELTMPEETFNVFFVFLHAWHHFCETGMCMKQLCDIAILLHAKREVITNEQLREMLRKLSLMEVWQLIMYIMVQYLGVSQEECPFYTEKSRQRAELLFERVMTEGQARQHERLNADGLSYLRRKWMTFMLRISERKIVRPYAPQYARHMLIGDILHGFERTLAKK